jgi:ABC-2 type transport system ATP-binding protein
MVAELCTRRGGRFRLRVQGERSAFRESLQQHGVTILADDGEGEWRIAVPEGWKNLRFFHLACTSDALIRSLVPDDETLEELFLRTIGDAVGAA